LRSRSPRPPWAFWVGGERRRSRDRRSGTERRQQPANPLRSGALELIEDGLYADLDGSISGNTASASTSSGTVIVQGGGIANGGTLTLRNTTVTSNSGAATGPSGSAQGGGIWNGDVGFGPSHLTLTDSSITHNALTGSANISIDGGGLFTAFPVTLTNSKITGNTPDNCFGVSC
jgi:hypothetical protein